MAGVAGVSKSTVHRVWQELGLKPHQVDTFKVSNDPKFEEKLVDVVGLYLNPPENAIVLCADEKSSVQALDRTQASLLPMTKGRGQTMTHDYKRNGTTTLFAALNVLTGMVIGQCLPRHRHQEFLEVPVASHSTERFPRSCRFHVDPGQLQPPTSTTTCTQLAGQAPPLPICISPQPPHRGSTRWNAGYVS